MIFINGVGVFYFALNLDDAEAFKNRENKNCNDADGSDIFNDNCEKCFPFKLSALFNFFNKCFRFNNITYKNAGEKSNDWHNHTIAYKVEEVKELESNNGKFAPDAVT